MKTEEIMKRMGEQGATNMRSKNSPGSAEFYEEVASYFENTVIDGVDGMLVAFHIREHFIKGRDV